MVEDFRVEGLEPVIALELSFDLFKEVSSKLTVKAKDSNCNLRISNNFLDDSGIGNNCRFEMLSSPKIKVAVRVRLNLSASSIYPVPVRELTIQQPS